MKVKINWKSPQALLSFVASAVAVAGTAGIIDTDLSGAIQALLTAVLGVVVAVGHHTAYTRSLAKKSAASGV